MQQLDSRQRRHKCTTLIESRLRGNPREFLEIAVTQLTRLSESECVNDCRIGSQQLAGTAALEILPVIANQLKHQDLDHQEMGVRC